MVLLEMRLTCYLDFDWEVLPAPGPSKICTSSDWSLEHWGVPRRSGKQGLTLPLTQAHAIVKLHYEVTQRS